MIPDSALDDLRARNAVTDIAGRWVSLRRGSKAGWLVGPCPLHSPNPNARDSTSFECSSESWVCAACQDGGDVIKLVMLREKLDFRAAVEWLGGAQQVDPAEEARRAAERAERRRRQEEESERRRRREQEAAHGLWSHGAPIAGTVTEDYLREVRGLAVPPGARLRHHGQVGYYVQRSRDGRTSFDRLHVGPAMLAAIIGPADVFTGVHITWLDLAQPKGKLVLHDPETGEMLPAKKVRGSQAGGRIELLRCATPRRLFIGEGIETVLSVYSALAALGRPLDGAAMWSSISIGNLCGPAVAGCRVPHPTAKDKGGRTLRVPGAEPDFTKAAIVVPESVVDLRLLGDGDSDPFTTRLAMERAEARHAAPGRRVSTRWPAAGCDFNNMLVA